MAAPRKITTLLVLLNFMIFASAGSSSINNDTTVVDKITSNQYYSECMRVGIDDFAYSSIIQNEDQHKNSTTFKFNMLPRHRQFYHGGASCGALWLKRGEQYSMGNFTETVADQKNQSGGGNGTKGADEQRRNNRTDGESGKSKTNKTEIGKIGNGKEVKQKEKGVKIKKQEQFVQLKNNQNKALLKQSQNVPIWQVDFSSDIGFTLPASIDAEFPYLQLGPEEFEGLFDYFFTVYGFFPEFESSHKYDKVNNQAVLRFTTNQTCGNIYGCFQGFNFELSGPESKQTKNAKNILNFNLDPRDYLIDSGNNQCTIGITTCANKDAYCPIILGKLVMNQFDAVLDYDSNSVWMREEPEFGKTKLKRPKIENYACKSTSADDDVRPKGMLDKALDLYIQIDSTVRYLSQPKNLYQELVGRPHAWVLHSELIIGAGSVIITLGAMFLGSMTGLIYLSQQIVQKFVS